MKQKKHNVVPQTNMQQGNAPVARPITKKKKSNPLIFLIILVVVIIGVFLFINYKKGNVVMGPNGNSQTVTKDKINTGTEWGDEYAYYIQTLFDDVSVMDVAFVDFDGDEIPEMTVKYLDAYEEEVLKLYYILNNNVYESKAFYAGSFKLLYSLKNHTSKWYLYLANSKNFGAYTGVEKIMNGIAYDSDIKVGNTDEKKKFNGNYIESDFFVTYYEVNKGTFIEDFETVISRYDKYVLDIQNAKDALDEKYKDYVTDTDKPKETHISVGEYKLPYGTYVYQGVNGINKVHTLKIYESGLIAIDDISYKFTINLNGYFELANGQKVAVVDNTRVVYDEQTYTFSTAN